MILHIFQYDNVNKIIAITKYLETVGFIIIVFYMFGGNCITIFNYMEN